MRKLIMACLMIGIIAIPYWIAGEEEKESLFDEQAERFNGLISQLGSDDFDTRQKAQDELIQIGEKLIEEYKKVKTKNDNEKLKAEKSKINDFAVSIKKTCQNNDPEIKTRANQIRRHFYYQNMPEIAFISNESRNCVINLIKIDGTNCRQLKTEYGNSYWPDWSPDGKKIVFTAEVQGNFEIRVMDADGRNERRLTRDENNSLYPVWSPDGKKIAFRKDSKQGRIIYIMDADGKSQKPLTDDEDILKTIKHIAINSEEISWSPDGKKIAFVSGIDGNPEIYTITTDGKTLQRLTENPAEDVSPAWSADGKKIVFTSNRDGENKICVMPASPPASPSESEVGVGGDVNGKDQRILTQGCSPACSPDGKKIAFVRSHTIDCSDIYIMDLDGSNEHRLTSGHGGRGSPSWKPGGVYEISELFKER
ncbi:MAG: PD40 domain-containing protein [Planctomycetes bacterium]|nr:PD40 domain-containing protein [Planctomycetota bacterium]